MLPNRAKHHMWDFISGEIRFFQFGLWSIFYSRLHEILRNEAHYGCYYIAILSHYNHFDRNKISFRVIKCYVTTTSKWNYTKGNICAREYKGNLFFRIVVVAYKQNMYLLVFPIEVASVARFFKKKAIFLSELQFL